jgi:hypothetical protein
MIEIEKKAQALFDKIRSRFENVSLGDEKAKSTDSPEAARNFNFDYTSQKTGNNLGNIHLNIMDPDVLKIYYGQNITQDMDDLEVEEWANWLSGMRKWARRHLMTFTPLDISKSNLELRDVKQQTKSDGTFDSEEVVESVINESMYGSRINSYEDRGPVRIRVKHSDFIDPEKRGARARKIEAIYLETHRGERFLLDHNNLHYARAAARHLAEGGQLYDDFGQHITGVMSEMESMKHFVRGAQLREFDDPETTAMVKSAVSHYQKQKDLLKRLRKSKDYRDYKEAFVPENAIEDDINIDALRERFVKKLYDDRFDEALPYVYRAYQRDQDAMETAMAEEFASWANTIEENTWDSPDSDNEIADLDKIMAAPLEVGQDGLDSQAALDGIIGDDALFAELNTLSKSQGPEADARPTILDWLRQHNPEVAAKYDTGAQPPLAPEQPAMPNQTTAAPSTDEPVVNEDQDLSLIKILAGLVKK